MGEAGTGGHAARTGACIESLNGERPADRGGAACIAFVSSRRHSLPTSEAAVAIVERCSARHARPSQERVPIQIAMS